MTTITETRVQLEKLDQQIIRLLADRFQLMSDARDRGEGLDSKEVESETISAWIEESADHGLDEVLVEKIAGLVVRLSREGGE